VAPVPKGEHFLEVRFEDTPVRVAGKWISLASLLGVVVTVIWLTLAKVLNLRKGAGR